MNIQTVKYNDFTFIDVHDPQDLEIKHLRKEYGFSSIHLADYLHKRQLPQQEANKDYLMVVLDFPLFDAEKKEEEGLVGQLSKIILPNTNGEHTPKKETTPEKQPPKRQRIKTGHVNFFIGSNYLVVLHDEKTRQVDDVFAECQKTLHNRQEFMGDGPLYLFYKLTKLLVENTYTTMSEITSMIDHIDKEITENFSPRVVEDISTTRRNLVVSMTMMKQALPVFRELAESNEASSEKRMTYLWNNISDHLQKIADRIEDNRELIEGIAISNESLLTFRTNEIVKVLTMFTAILLPLTLFASIYGMNIAGLPFAQDHFAFLIIIEIMIVLAVGMFLFFKLKKWL